MLYILLLFIPKVNLLLLFSYVP